MVTAVVVILLAPFVVLTAFFVLEVLAGLRSIRADSQPPAGASAVIVIPAHDEAAVIGETLRTLMTDLPQGTRVLVIADNCTDATARLAREAGADVLERSDPERRGKGHALAFAAEALKDDPPDVFAVLDADCRMDGASIRALVRVAASGRPAQAINLLRPDRTSPPLVQISTFAFLLKNLVRQRGLQRLAGRVHLTGTGMAMPYALFRASGDVRSSIVEDLALGLELSQAGYEPSLVSDATVWSSGSNETGTLTQRRRWEGGFLAAALRQGPKMLFQGLSRGKWADLLAGLDLLVPPLALFGFLNGAVLAAAVLLTWMLDLGWWPVSIHAALLAFAGLAIFLVWRREGREFISIGVLARLPLYVLWKLPMYVGLVRRGTPREWLRTGR
ncbi:MAG: glycosyltransferase family 2 protein [Sphingomonas sp.]|nr:glycosyltransferase family 2 protein [Sphingomonas sp.]